MLTTEQIDRLLSEGGNVLSTDGEKIGSIGQVFVDNDNGQPIWVTVRTGLFGMSESFVPLQSARTEGNDIVVPYSKNQVKDAPRIDADHPLDPAKEDHLYRHYQIDSGRATTEQRDTTGTDRTGAPATTPGYDTTGIPTGQHKRPDIGSEQPATGGARLRKYVTTENITRTVPVQREEVRLEREPITEENRSEVLNRPDNDDEREVILHEERIIVTKETVPVERVHIGTETVNDEVTINEEVRKEHIDTEGTEGTAAKSSE